VLIKLRLEAEVLALIEAFLVQQSFFSMNRTVCLCTPLAFWVRPVPEEDCYFVRFVLNNSVSHLMIYNVLRRRSVVVKPRID